MADNSGCTNLHYNLSRWDEMKHWPFGQQHVELATKIAVSVVNDQHYQLYQRFICAMDNWVLEKLLTCSDFRKTYIFFKLKEKKYDEVVRLIKTGTFTDTAGLLELWDKVHYQQKEDLCGRALTPVMKFRIRQRNPPPENICPSGLRSTPKLTSVAKEILTAWFKKNKEYPYPTKIDKALMAKTAGITLKQVKTWFANARRRHKGRNRDATNGESRKYVSCVDHTVAPAPNTDDHATSSHGQIVAKQKMDSMHSVTIMSSRPVPGLSTSESIRALQECCNNVEAKCSKGSTRFSAIAEECSLNISNASLANDNGIPRAIASPDIGDVTRVASLPSPRPAMALETPSAQHSFRPYHEGQLSMHGSSSQLSQKSAYSHQNLGNLSNMCSPSTDYGIYNNGNNVQCVPSYTLQEQWLSREYWWQSLPTPNYYLPCASPLSPPFSGNELFERNNVIDVRRSYIQPTQNYGESLVADNMLDVPFFPSIQVLEPVKMSEDPFGIQKTLIGTKEDSNPEDDAVQGLLDLSSATPDLTNRSNTTNTYC
ncbi:hypothetical protein ACJMK2_011565 [Sinanodonta woodiana]|uniref:Homeobox domain-containing protein n=1 Tax=Sinanodonta woodiana TaxID=1069815 RepID=A0ABD3V5F0_SINWO